MRDMETILMYLEDVLSNLIGDGKIPAARRAEIWAMVLERLGCTGL